MTEQKSKRKKCVGRGREKGQIKGKDKKVECEDKEGKSVEWQRNKERNVRLEVKIENGTRN